jgi:hypothetical protein
MKNRAIQSMLHGALLFTGPLAGLGVLWFLFPGLAATAGVVLGLFAIACWREGLGPRSPRLNSISVADFQRRLSL